MVRGLEEKLQTDMAVMTSQDNVLHHWRRERDISGLSGLSLKIKTVISEASIFGNLEVSIWSYMSKHSLPAEVWIVQNIKNKWLKIYSITI